MRYPILFPMIFLTFCGTAQATPQPCRIGLGLGAAITADDIIDPGIDMYKTGISADLRGTLPLCDFFCIHLGGTYEVLPLRMPVSAAVYLPALYGGFGVSVRIVRAFSLRCTADAGYVFVSYVSSYSKRITGSAIRFSGDIAWPAGFILTGLEIEPFIGVKMHWSTVSRNYLFTVLTAGIRFNLNVSGLWIRQP